MGADEQAGQCPTRELSWISSWILFRVLEAEVQPFAAASSLLVEWGKWSIPKLGAPMSFVQSIWQPT